MITTYTAIVIIVPRLRNRQPGACCARQELLLHTSSTENFEAQDGLPYHFAGVRATYGLVASMKWCSTMVYQSGGSGRAKA